MSRYLRSDSKTYEAVRGAVVTAVEKQTVQKEDQPDIDQVILTLADGRTLWLALDGDCCSHSYYADPKQFDELIGATIQQIEERDGKEEQGGEVSWHFLVFTTDKGHVTIDWRNDSNGYYDGSVHPSLHAPVDYAGRPA
jgi:hypothetical protein